MQTNACFFWIPHLLDLGDLGFRQVVWESLCQLEGLLKLIEMHT